MYMFAFPFSRSPWFIYGMISTYDSSELARLYSSEVSLANESIPKTDSVRCTYVWSRVTSGGIFAQRNV